MLAADQPVTDFLDALYALDWVIHVSLMGTSSAITGFEVTVDPRGEDAVRQASAEGFAGLPVHVRLVSAEHVDAFS